MMFIEYEVRQINKYGEELCGDNVGIVRNPDSTIIVLSDGLGSGVKANILSTMTMKIVSTMLSNGMELEDVVETVVNTLPVCQARKIAYSTFTIVQIFNNEEIKLVEFDNPDTLYFHRGYQTPFKSVNTNIAGKDIKISSFKLSKNDFLVLVSDGLIHAGLGGLLKLGWGHDKIGNFVERNITPETDAAYIADKLVYVANELYQGRIGDDTSIVVVKVRDKRHLCIAVGPPVDKEKDKEMVDKFLQAPGKKIICGGTTAKIIANATNKDIKVILNEKEKNVPPKAEIDGIDLVTEGVVTLSRTVEIIDQIKQYNLRRENRLNQDIYSIYGNVDTIDTVLENSPKMIQYIPQNPAEELVLELHKADHIKFIVGRAINPAHQNPNFPVQSGLKFKLINEIKEKLEKNGKEIEIEYF